MPSSFPTALDSLTNPTGTDSMETVAHAANHAAANDAIEALQATVGITDSADTDSHDYLIKQAEDPGHTHTAASITDLAATVAEVEGYKDDAEAAATAAQTAETNAETAETNAEAAAAAAAARATVGITGNTTPTNSQKDKYFRYTGSGGHTFTIPHNTTQAIDNDAEFDLFNASSFDLTVQAESSVSVNNYAAGGIILPPNAYVSFKKNATNTWDSTGYGADSWTSL